jgi:hypothetical protein
MKTMEHPDFSSENAAEAAGKPALRKINEKLYLKGNGQFTSDPEEAYLVCTLTEALELCHRYKLSDIGLVSVSEGEEEEEDLEPAEEASLIPIRGTYLKVA